MQALIVVHGIAESDQQMVQFALSVYCKVVAEKKALRILTLYQKTHSFLYNKTITRLWRVLERQ